jgi:DNA-binding transcriptional LysR family regulator
MQTDQLNGLIALKVVAEQRNFRAAAKILRVSASAISQAIKQLESRLGVALLSRTTRSTSVTEAGQRFLSEAGPALDQLIQAMAAIGDYAQKPTGLLRIGLSRAIYPTLMEPLILSFAKKHPDVTVELVFDDDLTDVVEQGFDAGIRLSEYMAKDMVAQRLSGPLHFVTVGSPKYFNKAGYPKHPKDLLSHCCIRMRFGRDDLYDRWEFERKGKDFQVHVNGTLILNDPILIIGAAIQGAGIMYCARELIAEEIRTGKLEVVLEAYAANSDGFYLYYPRRSQVLPKLRAFVEHLRAENRERTAR